MKLYKEMSIAVADSMTPVPDSFCESVMGKILDEKDGLHSEVYAESVNIDSKGKKEKNGITYFKRYLPAVACFVVILLVLPFAHNLRNQTNYDEPIWVDDGTMSEIFSVEEDEQVVIVPSMADMMPTPGGSSGDAEDVAPVPPTLWQDSAPSPPTEQAPIEHVERHDIMDVENRSAVAAIPPTAESEPVDARTQVTARSHVGVFGSDEQEVYAGSVPERAMQNIEGTDLDSVIAFEQLVRGAYVWIEITGQLPSTLRQHEAEPMGEWSVWEQFFKISREEAQLLIEGIHGHEGVTVTQGDIDSEYAVVLFASSN
jgi:hypothetical protein